MSVPGRETIWPKQLFCLRWILETVGSSKNLFTGFESRNNIVVLRSKSDACTELCSRCLLRSVIQKAWVVLMASFPLGSRLRNSRHDWFSNSSPSSFAVTAESLPVVIAYTAAEYLSCSVPIVSKSPWAEESFRSLIGLYKMINKSGDHNADINRGWEESMNWMKVCYGHNLVRVYYFDNSII